MLLDPEILGDELAELVIEQVNRATAPLRDEIRALKATVGGFRQPEDGKDADPLVIRREVALALAELPKPKDGESIDAAALSSQIIEAAAKAVEALPKPKDGMDFDPASFDAAVRRAVDSIPRPEPGKDADSDAIAAEVLAKVTKALEAIPAPKDGKDADLEVMRSAVRDEVQRAVSELPKPKDGDSVDMVALSAQIIEAAAAAVGAIPRPKDGENVDPAVVEALVATYVAKLPKPKDGDHGKSVTVDDIRPLLQAEVAKAVEAIPRPKDGDNGEAPTAEDLAPFLRAEVERAVSAIPVPKNGLDFDPVVLSGAVVAEVAKAFANAPKPADGKSVNLDEVRPILEGEVAKWALEFERRAADTLQREIDRMPTPKDGNDGLGFDDLRVEYDSERSFAVIFERGQERKEFKFAVPVVLDRGSYTFGQTYQRGDCITYAGALWIAQDTISKPPGDRDPGWRLAVKRGKAGTVVEQ